MTKHIYRWRSALLRLAIICAALAALATSATPARADDGPEPAPPGPPAGWDADADLPAPGAPMPQAGRELAAEPGACLGAPGRAVRYTSDGVIHLQGCGQSFRLSDLVAAGIGADKLELTDRANKIWLLKVKLKVEEGATLVVAGGATGDANVLRLLSTPSVGVWLRADNGGLRFESTKITTWDPARNGPDTDPSVAADGTGGRSYIATRSVLTKGRATAPPTACGVNGGTREPYEGRMDIVNSELSYLGYYAGESYGVSWKVYYKVNSADPVDAPPPGRQLYAMVDVFGNISGSSFHHNYFGSYTFGGYCMRWSGNTFASNVMYGLDPHDDSDFLTIERNVFRDNGTHGVICSVECDHLVIRDNQSYRNEHGIMLHRNVNGALVERNISRDNRGAGIAIFDSHDAIVRDNTVSNNGESAVRMSVGASRNRIENNTLTGLAASGTGPGYVIYTFKGSDLPTAGDGRPAQNIFRANRLTGYKHPLIKLGDATANLFEANTIAGAVTDLALVRAPANTIRNSPLGQRMQISMDATSSVALTDTRGAVWKLSRAGLNSSVTAARAVLGLNATIAGAQVDLSTLPLRVRPQSGTVVVNTDGWVNGARAWSERSSDASGAVAHWLGGLAASSCYAVVANGRPLGNFRADSAGEIAFSYGGGYSAPVQFRSNPTPCAGGAPEANLFLPLAQG